MYYVAVVCPPHAVALPDGYSLTHTERVTLAATMVGIPITVQHANIRTIVARMQPNELNCPAHVAKHVDKAGTVTAAWVDRQGAMWAIFDVDKDLIMVNDLIDKGHLGAVSLTHVQHSAVPIELSLCSVPARPGALIKHRAKELKDAVAYKAVAEQVALASLNAAMDAKTASPLEAFMATLSPENKALLQTRMTDMVNEVDKARSNEQIAVAAKEKLEKVTNVDRTLMKQQLDYLIGLFSEDDKELYQVGNDAMFEALKECPPGALQSMANLIKCASANLAREKGSAHRGANKRQRDPVPEVTYNAETKITQAAKPMPDSANEELSPLQRAMAAQFN
jgi:hypothetical protein